MKLDWMTIALLVALSTACGAQDLKSEVPADHWAYSTAEGLRQRGIIVGVPDGYFRKSKGLTRGDFAIVLQRFAGRVLPTADEPTHGSPGGDAAGDWQAMERLLAEYREDMLAAGSSAPDLRRLLRFVIRQKLGLAPPPKLDQKIIFKDIPRPNAIYGRMAELQDSGILAGYPERYFSGRRILTPYEIAVATNRALCRAYPLGLPAEKWPDLKPTIRKLLNSLADEYYPVIRGIFTDERSAFALAEYWVENNSMFSDTPNRQGTQPSSLLPAGHWAYHAARTLQAKGLIVNVSEGYFEGSVLRTRLAFAQRLWELRLDRQAKGLPPLTSVPTEGICGGVPGFAPVELGLLRLMVREFAEEIRSISYAPADVDRIGVWLDANQELVDGIISSIGNKHAVQSASDTQQVPRTFSDIDRRSWVYQAFEELRDAGLPVGWSSARHFGRGSITRYEAAVMIDRWLATLRHGDPPVLGAKPSATLRGLVAEFRRELEEIGVKRADIEAALARLAPLQGGTPDRFVDLPVGHWAYPAVEGLRQKGVFTGYPDGLYRGERAVTRAEMAAAISRALAGYPWHTICPSGAMGPTGKQGEKGRRGEAGARGPKGEAPGEVVALQQLMQESQETLESLSRQLDAAARKAEAIRVPEKR